MKGIFKSSIAGSIMEGWGGCGRRRETTQEPWEGVEGRARGVGTRPRDYLCSSPSRNFARTIYYGYTCHLESQNFIMTPRTLSTTGENRLAFPRR